MKEERMLTVGTRTKTTYHGLQSRYHDVDSGRKECPLRYGGAGFRFGRRETPEIFGCDYLAVEMDDGDISFPFISMR